MINQSVKFFHGRFDLHTFQFSERQHPASFIPEFPLYEFGPQVKETCDALYDHLLKKLALGKLVTGLTTLLNLKKIDRMMITLSKPTKANLVEIHFKRSLLID